MWWRGGSAEHSAAVLQGHGSMTRGWGQREVTPPIAFMSRGRVVARDLLWEVSGSRPSLLGRKEI